MNEESPFHFKPNDARYAAIHLMVVERYRAWYGEAHMANGSCLYWTLTGMGVLRQLGLRPVLQAGSMSWPILPPAMDDGRRPTHFTYEWSPQREESQAALRLGLLPEIHIWIALPDQNQLVDFSTKYFPHRATQEGLEWHTPHPPDFLWCGPHDMPAGVYYRPNLQAIAFILRLIQLKYAALTGID